MAIKRVLIVEDNDDNRIIYETILRHYGYDVLTAADGRQGLEAARAGTPDLVLMDMSLPVLDRWEATRQLKADPRTRHVPVIALTAHAMAGDREKALAAGCKDLGKVRALFPSAGAERVVATLQEAGAQLARLGYPHPQVPAPDLAMPVA